MNAQIYIIEYDIKITRMVGGRESYPKHCVEKRTTLKSFEDLLNKISNDINVNQNSIKKYKAEEIA